MWRKNTSEKRRVQFGDFESMYLKTIKKEMELFYIFTEVRIN